MYVRLLIVDLEIDDSPGSQTSDMSLLKAESVWAGIWHEDPCRAGGDRWKDLKVDFQELKVALADSWKEDQSLSPTTTRN